MDSRIDIINNIMKKINIEKNYSINLLNQLEYFKNIHNETKYKVTKKNTCKSNYNIQIENFFNKNINEIINNELDINQFIPIFYENKLNSKFISNKIKISIINNLFKKTLFESKFRKIVIFSKNNISNKFLKKIDSIFNFFDIITSCNNFYKFGFK